MAAAVLARKIIAGQFRNTGAMPCLGMITLQEYLGELDDLNIKTYER